MSSIYSLPLSLMTVFTCSTSAFADFELSIGGGLEAGDNPSTQGANVQIEYSVTNTGSSVAEDVIVGFYFSEDATLDSSDILVETETVSVEEMETEGESEQIPVPGGITDGCRFIILSIDDGNFFPETNESNNTSVIPIAIDEPLGNCIPLPDLQVEAGVSANASSLAAGEFITVTATLRNNGPATASDAEIFLFLSDDGIYDGYFGEVFLDFAEEDVLFGNGDQVSMTLMAQIDSATTPGDYTLFIVADAGDDIAESDEANNRRQLPLTITQSGPFSNFCFGDLSASCPCSNEGTSSTSGGCENSQGLGAELVALGSASNSQNNLEFELRDAPPATFALLVSADQRLGGGAGVIGTPASDGLRCVGGNFLRHGLTMTDAQGFSEMPWRVDAGMSGFTAGQTRHFQVRYRDAENAQCGTGQNTSQGVSVLFSM